MTFLVFLAWFTAGAAATATYDSIVAGIRERRPRPSLPTIHQLRIVYDGKEIRIYIDELLREVVPLTRTMNFRTPIVGDNLRTVITKKKEA